MIPLKLELKNFLSYGELIQTISLSDYSLICFSGKNGNGKSAILDAITWSIWGQARKISGTIKPDAGLLRLGQTHMFVSLEFEFSGQIYRVRREYAKTYGKPYVALDFELFDKQADKFISLTDKTIRVTQNKIEKLLGLDYETFVNSAFLRQGLADEFSKKSPKERKQILTTILGLNNYDELQSLATEKVKSFQEEKKFACRLQEQADEQIKRKQEIDKQLTEKKELLESINKEFVQLQNDLNLHQKEKNLFLQQKQETDFLLKEKYNVQAKFDANLKDFKKLVLDWKQIHHQSLQMSDFEELEKNKAKLDLQQKDYLEQQQRNLVLQEQLLHDKTLHQNRFNELQKQIEWQQYEKRLLIDTKKLEQQQILDSIKQKKKQQEEANEKYEQIQKELGFMYKKLKEYNDFKKELVIVKNQFEKRRAFYQILIQKGNWTKAEQKELEQKKVTMSNQESPSCPLCEQVLTVKRKKFLGLKFEKEEEFLLRRVDRISDLIKKLKDFLVKQHEQMQKLLEQDDLYKQMHVKIEELNKTKEENERELEKLNRELSGLQIQEQGILVILQQQEAEFKEQDDKKKMIFDNDPEMKKLAVQIGQIEKKQKDLRYDKNIHLELQKDLKKIEEKLQDCKILKEGLLEQRNRKNRIILFIKELKDIKKSIARVDKKLKDLNFDIQKEQQIEKKINEIKKETDRKLMQKEKILQDVGSIENELKRIEKLKEENEQRKTHIKFLETEIEEYQILVQSFGKNGIQALLLEEVIPRIEEEANNILARLSDNQAQVFIESLRDLKSGGVKETLDIQISDSAGIRPYEMYSGGEAFRVDFALRIAISKLLAHRAGTALQTLIIDEGFGSQDEEGLSRLMDAIYAIGKDFSKIIVVSHLTNFKDNFPVHFVVNKNAYGSFVQVEERG